MFPTQRLPVHYRYNLDKRTLSYISSSCQELSGYTPQELVGRDHNFYKTLFLPSDVPIVRSKTGFYEDESIIHSVYYQILTKCGKVKRVCDRFTAIKDSSDRVLAIEGTISEASTEQQNTLDELVAYRDAININTIVSITDLRGTIIYANDKFCTISKYSADELIGKNHRIVNSRHHSSAFFAEMWQTISSGKAWHGEILNKAKDGSLYWVDSVIMPIIGARGRITSYLSIRTLITDRKNAEVHQKLHLHNLQEMTYYVSHTFRGPICSILGLVNLMILQASKGDVEQSELLRHLVNASQNLEEVTQKLSITMNRYEIDFKRDLKIGI